LSWSILIALVLLLGLAVVVLRLRRAERGRTSANLAERDDIPVLTDCYESPWRWLHRWTALAMVLLVLVHVWTAMRFGSIL
jgi:hypothetical protein